MIKLLSFLILCYYSNHLVYLSHAFVTSTYLSSLSSSSSSSSSSLLLPLSRRRITKSSVGPRNDICIQNSVVLTSCNLSPPLSLLEFESSSSSILLSDITSSSDTTISSQTSDVLGLSTSTNIIIFIIGIIPFLWATYEFWSRIAVGASFGTGKDSIQIKPSSSNNDDDENGMTEQIIRTIGKDNDLSKSRGRRVLGDDALFIAYVLFGIAIGSVGIAVISVLTSTPPSNI